MKNKVFWYFTITIIIITLITLISSIVYTNNLNENIKADTMNNIFREVENKLSAFDNVLHVIEINMKNALENSFKNITKEILSRNADFSAWTPKELKLLAIENGVEDIYLINDQGIIVNTSFISDIGLDLFSINEAFTLFLKSIIGKGEIVTQRISVSNTTGIVKMYSYYSPVGSDFILEVSIALREYLESQYGEGTYDILVSDFFKKAIDSSEYLLHIDLIMLSHISRWSLIYEGKEFSKDIDFTTGITEGEIIIEETMDKIYLYKLIYIDGKHFSFENPFVLELILDFSALRSDAAAYFVKTAIITLIVITVLLIAGSFLFKEFVIKRIDKINTGISQIESGNYDINIMDGGRDEINHICRNINRMSRTILKRENELSEFSNEIRLLQDYLYNIIDSMPTIIIAIDCEYRITLWNKESKRKFLSDKEDPKRKPIWKQAPLLTKYRDHIQAVIKNKTPMEMYREKFNENDEETYNVVIFPIISKNLLQGIVFMIDDITDIERKDLLLTQSQKMEVVGILSGGLAHDFNNVLGSLVGNLSFIRHKLKTSSHIDKNMLVKHMEIMEKSVEKAQNIIKQLLTISRKYELKQEEFDLNMAISSCIDFLRNSFEKNISLEFIPYSERAIAKGDSTQIEQVMMNLCINSYHAVIDSSNMPADYGKILILTDLTIISKYFSNYTPDAKEGRYWKVSVMDNGVGMDREILTRIFDPFFSSRGDHSGTGLGLTMVYNIRIPEAIENRNTPFFKFSTKITKNHMQGVYIITHFIGQFFKR